MSDSQSVAIRILELIEHYHAENACLRILLKTNSVSRWPQKLQKLLDNPTLATDILEELGPIRREVMRSANPVEQLDALARCFHGLKRHRDRR